MIVYIPDADYADPIMLLLLAKPVVESTFHNASICVCNTMLRPCVQHQITDTSHRLYNTIHSIVFEPTGNQYPFTETPLYLYNNTLYLEFPDYVLVIKGVRQSRQSNLFQMFNHFIHNIYMPSL